MASALHADVLAGPGPRLVLVHGFTQTRRSWGPVADLLSIKHELVLVDAPGHGRSGDVRATLPDGARLIGEVGGPAAYLGYSMGGRFVLHLALDRPELVRAMVLVGATPGIEDAAERAARRDGDHQWARLAVSEGVDAFLDRWLAGPLFRNLTPEAQGRDARRENTATGLASSLRLAGTGSQESLWPRLARLDMPVLLVVGEQDPKFRAVAERMASSIGLNATLAVIPRAGHAAHLEQPADFAATVLRFLADAL
jgi:2-succinyl-6-hydroxy-2,4-cyclohexadiene-1-carboxylate synthase